MSDLPLLKGTLDLLVLKALSWGALHGYAISSWLEQQSSSTLQIDDSALYQALHRLEDRALIEGEWGLTGTGRRARFYKLTKAGRQRLQRETDTWLRYTQTVSSILTVATRGA
jgi:PadR family transcriptional regulator PadR